MLRQIRSGVVALLAIALGACGADSGTTVERPIAQTRDAKASEALPEPATVELVPVSFTEWESRRAAMAPNIVVVDLWASWCVPCLERFPHMVKMHDRYKDRGVQFVSLSLDDREDPSSIDFARDFLREQDARFPHYLLDEDIMDGFEQVGIQTIPAVNIYARDGSLAVELNNNNPNDQFTDDDIEQAILVLLDVAGATSGR